MPVKPWQPGLTDWSALAVRVLAALSLLLVLAPAARAGGPSCANPQAAARSLLDWLQPDNWQPSAAATCLDVPPDQTSRAEALAVQLKQILDARGLYVPTSDLPTDPDYKDAEGRARLVPVASAPTIYLEKRGDRWLWSRSTVNAIPTLYEDTFSSFALALQRHLPSFFFNKLLGFYLWQYLHLFLLVLMALVAGWLAQKILADQVVRVARRFEIHMTAKVVRRTRGPLTWAAGGAVFLWGIPDLQLGVRASEVLLIGARALLSFSVIIIAIRLVDVATDFFVQHAARTESKLDDQLIPLVSRAAKVTIFLLGVVFVLENLGVDVGSLLAGLGLGGLAFALAAKDTVENLFGSITIFTDRPFQIGDWIVVDGSIEGVVEEVGFRSTRIRTFYKSLVSVPNAKVANSKIDNMGQRPYRRQTATLGVRYDTPVERLDTFVKRVEQSLRDNPKVWDGVLEVHFTGFGASALEIMLYFFLDVPDWHTELAERAKAYMRIMQIAEELGVEFAFPSQSLYIEQLPDAPRSQSRVPA